MLVKGLLGNNSQLPQCKEPQPGGRGSLQRNKRNRQMRDNQGHCDD
jgi:hypothetical protein